MNISFKKILPVLFLLLIPVIFFLPYFINNKIPYVGDFTGSDLTELNLPLRFLAAESLKQGEVPLWTNLLTNGFPVLAEGQAGVFYPLNLILFTQLPFSTAINFTFLFNFFLAAFFIYLYCRELKMSQLGAMFAALAFSFSGFFIFRLKHLNLINTAIWLPLIFYLIEKYFRFKSKGFIIGLLAIVFSIQFFAGHPQIFYLSLISGFIYFCLKIFLEKKYKIAKLPVKLILPWIILGIIIFGLVAVQLIPTAVNSSISGRSMSMSYQDIEMFPYSNSSFSYFVSPYFLGNPAFKTFPQNIYKFGIFWENSAYFGILPLIFALLGIFYLSVRNNRVKLLTILGFISLLFVFGDQNPLFIIFWNTIPGFKMFRFPQRFLLTTLVCLTVISGFGFDWFFSKIKDYKKKLRIPDRSKLLLEALLPISIILITAIDLFLVSFNYVGFLDYQKYFSKPKSVEFLETDKDYFKIYSFNWQGVWNSVNTLAGGWQNNLSFFISGREMIWPNMNVFWDIPSVQDRASFEGGMLFREMHNLGNQVAMRGFNEDNISVKVNDEALSVLGLQNVKYLLAFKELENQNLELVKEVREDFLPPLKIYKNDKFLPFAFGVFSQQVEKDLSKSVELLFSPEFDFTEKIIVEKNDISDLDQGESKVEIVYNKGKRVEVKADFSKPGYLFLALPFYPGWQAKVDGENQDILRANYAFSSLKLEAGNHLVVLEFKPMCYQVGKIISLFTFFVLVAYLIYSFINLKIKHE